MQSDNSVDGVGRGGRRADVPFLPNGLAGGAKRAANVEGGRRRVQSDDSVDCEGWGGRVAGVQQCQSSTWCSAVMAHHCRPAVACRTGASSFLCLFLAMARLQSNSGHGGCELANAAARLPVSRPAASGHSSSRR